MNKLKAFVRLDFLTVKPYFTARTVLIYGGLILFLTVFSGSAISGLGVGMMLGTLFSAYPFALGEGCNLDALYTTVSVSRKTVVRGRYLFALMLDACSIASSYILATLGLCAARALGMDIPPDGAAVQLLPLGALFIIIQAFQLPVYFKLGYSKAKLLSILPFAAVAGLYGLILGGVKSGTPVFPALYGSPDIKIVLPVVAALCAAVYLSYRLAAAFYAKREL